MNGKSLIFVSTLVAAVLLFLVSALLAGEPACTARAACGARANSALQAKPQAKTQTLCPVMGGKVDKNFFADVKGHRVYACCAGCLLKIKADPDKSLAKIRANGERPVALCKCGAPKGSAACKLACGKAKPADIDTPALGVLLSSPVPLVVLDARIGKWDDGRRIPGARTLSPKATAAEAAALIKTKNTLVVTYCSSVKCPASRHLAERLRSLGYTNVLEYPKGIQGWTTAGRKIDGAGK